MPNDKFRVVNDKFRVVNDKFSGKLKMLGW